MVEELEIITEQRNQITKSQLKLQRKKGYIPAVSYGSGKQNTLLWVKQKNILDVMKKGSLEGTIFNLKIAEKKYPVIVKELQKDVISSQPIHIDFQIISMKEKIEVKVPVKLVGEEVALKLTGGIIDFPMRELKIKCLPTNIPKNIELDVTNLKIGQGIYIKDIPQEKFTIMEDINALVVHIIAKKIEEVTPTAETVGATTIPTEPEVIAKGKKLEEGEETTPTK